MKLTLTLGAVLCLISLNGYAAVDFENNDDAPLFVKTMRLLQRGPPEFPTKGRSTVETKTIEQKLDHFDENETRTWQMRYMTNDEYFKAGGPIIIYVGGPWEISAGMITWGHLWDIAREHNGYLFYTEHRYYGESLPTSSLTTENLQYLHVKQALADLAHFIRTMKETVPGLSNSKVIPMGGAYAGTMVVWFKRLYPELMDGGWASSAPLLAKVDFEEYKEVAGRAYLELGSYECFNRIHKGISELEFLIANKCSDVLVRMLKFCNNFDVDNELDVWMLFSSISNAFAGIAQYQVYNDIPNTCNYLMYFEDDITALTNFILYMFGSDGCVDVSYMSTVKYYAETSIGADRAWLYQICNEFGWFQSSTSINQPFGTKFPVELDTGLCRDIFEGPFTHEYIEQQVSQTNADFGGMNPEVDNIYMSHGALDPWSPMGHGVKEGATVIPRTSHCNDFASITYYDTYEMRASKERLAELVRVWVSNNSSIV